MEGPRACPIKHIPPEMLSRIFVRYLGFQHEYTHTPKYYRNRLLSLTLASVCRHWREVACTTSEIWTTCWFSYTHPEFNKLWLSRTGSRLFDIKGLPGPSKVPGRSLEELLTTICPFMERCRILDIGYLECEQPFNPTSFFPKNLHQCTIEADTPSWLCHSISRSPRLQFLQVDRFSHHMIPALENLIDLVVAGTLDHPSKMRRILTDAEQLEKLFVHVFFDPEDQMPWIFDPITHECLYDVDLVFEESRDLLWVFDQMTLPSLQTLSVRRYGLEPWSETYRSTFYSFLERSQCALKSLMLSDTDSTSVVWALEQPSMSSLEELVCLGVEVTPQLLRFLTNTANLPRLHKLDLSDVSIPMDNPFFHLADMVFARRIPADKDTTKLKYFRLSVESYACRRSPYPESVFQAQVRRIETLAKSTKDDKEPLVVDIEDLPPDARRYVRFTDAGAEDIESESSLSELSVSDG